MSRDLASGQGGSAENEAVSQKQTGAHNGNRMSSFVNIGQELLLNLAKTVQELSGQAGLLKTVANSVENLEKEVQGIKRKSCEETENSNKKGKTSKEPEPSTSTCTQDDSEKNETDDIDIFLTENGAEEEENELDENLMDDLDQYFEKESETGEKISDKLAELVDRALKGPQKEDKFKELKDKYKRPENVEYLQVPTVDNTIWRALQRDTRAIDLQLQKNMNNIGTCMVPVIKTLELLQSAKDSPNRDKQIRGHVSDTFKLMCHFINGNLQQRKERIKKEKQLKPRVKTILNSASSSATKLFGDSLKEEMKVLSDKTVTVTIDNNGKKTNQPFLSKRGGYQSYHRKYTGPPHRGYREQERGFNKNQQQGFKKGTWAKNKNYKKT